MEASSRLVLNTLVQYLRTGANVILSLIATRLVLQALGSNDFGIYSLVGGIVSMLSFFTNALSSTTQRYLSYNSGNNDNIILSTYFLNSIVIHIILGSAISLVLVSLEPLLFNGFLNIQVASIESAKVVYYLLIIMLFVALMASPFRAVLLSHENIIYLSFIDIIDGVLKLIVAYLLFEFDRDRLIWYAVLMSLISVFNIIAFMAYCFGRYKECRDLKWSYIAKDRLKELTSFASWTIYGALCLFGRVQGVSIVINKFLGTFANAAFGIALQVNSALGSIAGALQTALSPQLIKAEGSNNRSLMIKLSVFGCKISFVLLSLFAFPLMFDISGILDVWLTSVPEYASYFCIIMILSNLFDQLTVGFNITMNAVGDIKNFTITINTIKFITVFIIAILLYVGVDIYWALFSYVIIEIIGCVLRVWFCHKVVNLNIAYYTKDVLYKLLFPVAAILSYYWLLNLAGFSLVLFAIKFIIGSIFYGVLIYFFSLNRDEKKYVDRILSKFSSKFKG